MCMNVVQQDLSLERARLMNNQTNMSPLKVDDQGKMVTTLDQAEQMHRNSMIYLQNSEEAKNRDNLMTPVMFVSKD